MIKILGIASSLRAGSVSTGLLRFAASKLPANVTMDIYIPKDLPLFNEDVEKDPIESVEIFRKKVKEADALLFSLCEYNHGLSGALKNALDWGSRGPLGNVFNEKPGAIMGVGSIGGARAQIHMREVASGLNIYLMNHPQIYVKIFDPSQPVNFKTGELNDKAIGDQIEHLTKGLATWTHRLRK